MYKSIVITLSVVSIDYRIFIFSNMFGLADQLGVPAPQAADSAPSLLCTGDGHPEYYRYFLSVLPMTTFFCMIDEAFLHE